MSIQVNCFQWEPGKNDAEYIKLLESSRDEWQKIAQKAIAKLKALSKAQEPRVMTLEEMEQAGKNGDAVYVETADGVHFWALAFPGIEPPKDEPFNYPGGVRFNAQDVDGDIYDGDFYGMTMPDGRVHHMAWRCWTSRPDEKRRAETPWN